MNLQLGRWITDITFIHHFIPEILFLFIPFHDIVTNKENIVSGKSSHSRIYPNNPL